jgi:alpha-tubulin suppressor-like RCC1 family protein
MSEVKAVAAGGEHTLALTRRCVVLALGRNTEGQLGCEPQVEHKKAVRALSEAAVIAAGRYHSLALIKKGEAWRWGCNDQGQIGGKGEDIRCRATKICSEVRAVAAGEKSSLALTKQGEIWTWGLDSEYTDGLPTKRNIPILVEGPGMSLLPLAFQPGGGRMINDEELQSIIRMKMKK